MRNRNPQHNPATACKCDKCELEVASAIPDTYHRNCPGKKGLPPRPYHDRLDKAERGKWQA